MERLVWPLYTLEHWLRARAIKHLEHLRTSLVWFGSWKKQHGFCSCAHHWSHLTLNRWHCRGKTCCVITTGSYWLPLCSPLWSLLSRWLSICSPPEISGARDRLLRLLEHALRWTYPASQGTPGLRGRRSIIVKHGWCSDMRGVFVVSHVAKALLIPNWKLNGLFQI